MVAQVKEESQKLTPNSDFLREGKIIRRNYTIEKRVFKDASFFGGWFRNMNVEWSEWTPIFSYTFLKTAATMHDALNARKSQARCRTEYRLVKEKNEESSSI